MAKRFHESFGSEKKYHANMPTEVIQTDWPKAGNPMDYKLDDTIEGIDQQLEQDHSKAKKHERKPFRG